MAPPPSSSTDSPVPGISLVMVGLFLFSLQDVAMKYFSDTYSVLQLVIIRCSVALVPILVAVVLTSGWRGVLAYKPELLLAKGFLGFLSYLTYYLAIAALPLAQVVTIVFAAPIFVTVLSALLLKESVGPRRWGAVLVGFAAIVIVVGPNGDFAPLGSALALCAAIAYACSIVLTRFIGPDDRPWTIALYSMLAFLAGGGVASVLVFTFGDALVSDHPSLSFLTRPWVLPEPAHLLVMVALGLNAAVGFYCLIKAYWIAPASSVAPFEYSYIVWAVLFGYLIWSEVPAGTTFLGVALLVGSSFYIFRRELALRRGDTAEPIAGATDTEGGVAYADSAAVKEAAPS